MVTNKLIILKICYEGGSKLSVKYLILARLNISLYKFYTTER